MLNPRIKQLMESIRSKQFSDSSWMKGDLAAAEFASRIKSVSEEYDQLLQQCLTMIDLIN